MATIKSFSDLQQSRKLAEILPFESADMCYYFMKDSGHLVNPSPFVLDGTEEREDGMFTYLNCWSLAALLSVLPKGTNVSTPKPINELGYCCWNQYDEIYASNPVDACVAMIEKLHELNLL